MRLIKTGMRERKVTCKLCGCIYAYTGKDIITQKWRYFPDDNYVYCPQCNYRHDVSKFDRKVRGKHEK